MGLTVNVLVAALATRSRPSSSKHAPISTRHRPDRGLHRRPYPAEPSALTCGCSVLLPISGGNSGPDLHRLTHRRRFYSATGDADRHQPTLSTRRQAAPVERTPRINPKPAALLTAELDCRSGRSNTERARAAFVDLDQSTSVFRSDMLE